jgi:mRNA-degrading endonuclease RelE of RelBE toxin-antitoxin system
MNEFHVALTEHAIADLRNISRDFRDQVHRDLKTLESAPFPSGTFIKRLKGFRPPVYRLCSGDFRVLYHIQGDNVAVLRIIDSKVLERIIKRLGI